MASPTATLPPGLLKLFQPRPALPFEKPIDKDIFNHKQPHFTGIGAFLERGKGHDPDYVRNETVLEKRERVVGYSPEACCVSGHLDRFTDIPLFLFMGRDLFKTSISFHRHSIASSKND